MKRAALPYRPRESTIHERPEHAHAAQKQGSFSTSNMSFRKPLKNGASWLWHPAFDHSHALHAILSQSRLDPPSLLG